VSTARALHADSPLDDSLVAVAAQRAAAAASAATEPGRAIDSAVEELQDSIPGVFPSVFVLEHERLWLVAQRGYPFVPDGLDVARGVMGRAVRCAEPQLAADVSADPDYVGALPAVTSELAVPLRARGAIVGVLNLESERRLPTSASTLLEPLGCVLAPAAERLRMGRKLDLPGLARLFVYLGSLREPGEIATLGAVSLARVLDIERSEVWVWDGMDAGALAAWSAEGPERPPLAQGEMDVARRLVDPSAICQLLDFGGPAGGSDRTLVWLPLRANGEELGVLAALTGSRDDVDAETLDTAAVLAAHVAASLDAALVLRRERQSALTDPLTGILNRRGLEGLLDDALPRAQERRLPLSVLVLDCDDFKEINDRAGHEFGDTLLREVADVLAASVPATAAVARLGGDEFLVVLPGADADAAEGLATEIREVLAEGLTEAGYPLRMSAGIATYPFDGAGPTTLLRAADQALYAAKDLGKDCIAAFRDVARPRGAGSLDASADGGERRRLARGDGSILAEVMAAGVAIEAEETLDGVCGRLAKALVFTVGATACTVSRIKGDLLIDASGHALREVSLGDDAAYRIADFPFTEETLRTGESRTVSFLDDDVDPAEAFILRELGMNAVLMIPMRVVGRSWGLVELYEMRLRRFSHDDVAVAQFLTNRAERRLELVAPTEPRRRRVYELPPGAGRTGPPRTR
jgi:diguanylate cyclase (GGDEF)-like protein